MTTHKKKSFAGHKVRNRSQRILRDLPFTKGEKDGDPLSSRKKALSARNIKCEGRDGEKKK